MCTVVHVCYPSIWEVEAGGSKSQSHPQLQGTVKAWARREGKRQTHKCICSPASVPGVASSDPVDGARWLLFPFSKSALPLWDSFSCLSLTQSDKNLPLSTLCTLDFEIQNGQIIDANSLHHPHQHCSSALTNHNPGSHSCSHVHPHAQCTLT